MAEVEKSGIPTVSLICSTFESEFKMSSKVFGVPGMPYAIVTDRQLGAGLTESQIQQRVEVMGIDPLVDGLTRSRTLDESHRGDTISLATELFGLKVPEREVFQGADRHEAWEEMNDTFLERQWGDGFRLVFI